MADNYVSLRIKATDEAKPDLADLKAKLDELSHKVATARAQVDDKEADAALTALDVKLRRIADKVVNPRIKMAGAERALADLLALDVAMDRFKAKADRMRAEADVEAAKGGLLARFFGGSRGGVLGLLGKIPGLGGLGGGGTGAEAGGGGLLDSVGSIAGTLGAAVPVVAALLVEVDGLASGFLAAGAGAGAFGLLALPAFKKVSTAYQQIHADQQAYDRALTATARNTALKHLQQDYASLDPAQRAAVKGIQGLTGEYDKLAKAFEPQVFKIFTDFLKIANQLLPAVVPFANTFASAMDKLLGQASKFAGSKGFGDWLKQFQALEGPSLAAIGAGLGHVITSVGKLFTIMSAKDVVNSINIAFSIIDGAILGLGWTISHIMHWWDVLSHAFDVTRHAAAAAGHGIAGAFDTVRHAAAQLGYDVAVWFDRIRHDIAAWVSATGRDVLSVSFWFDRLPGLIMKPLLTLPGMLFQVGQHAISMLISGLKSIPIAGTIISIGQEIWDHLPHSPAKKGPLSGSGSPDIAGRRIAQMLAQGLTSGVPDVGRAMGRVAGAAGHYGAYGGGHGGGAYEITLRMGPGSLLKAMQAEVRAVGGDPAMFQKKVAYR